MSQGCSHLLLPGPILKKYATSNTDGIACSQQRKDLTFDISEVIYQAVFIGLYPHRALWGYSSGVRSFKSQCFTKDFQIGVSFIQPQYKTAQNLQFTSRGHNKNRSFTTLTLYGTITRLLSHWRTWKRTAWLDHCSTLSEATNNKTLLTHYGFLYNALACSYAS